MASIDTVRLPTGQEYDIQDYGHYPLWSVFAGITANNPNDFWAFNYSTGQMIPNTQRMATDLDTNLSSANQGLGYAEEMMVYSIMIQLPVLPGLQSDDPEPYPTEKLLHDMLTLNEVALFSFYVTKKVYAEGTIDRFPFGGGLWAATTLTDQELVTNGFPVAGAQRPLSLPIHLMSEEPFYAILRCYPDTGNLRNTYVLDATTEERVEVGYDIRVWLDGIRRRPVA